MAEAHHDDHGNTPAAWFLTLSWITIWTGAAVMVMLGNSVILWTAITLGLSAACAVVSGLMKKAGLGAKPRTAPDWPEPATEPAEAIETSAETEPAAEVGSR